MKIVADNAIPFLKGVLEPYARVEYLPGKTIATADVRDADALIVRTRTRCDAALLEGSSVKLIATATIGFDHIDTAWCAAHGIRVATAAGCNARGVLQWAGAVLAHLARTQGWKPAQRTLGIVGVGHVGSLIREYACLWGFRVVCCDPPREEREHCGFLPLEEVARQADILTFHTPLDASTRHMAGEGLANLTSYANSAYLDGTPVSAAGLHDFCNGYLDVFNRGFHYAFIAAIVMMLVSLVIYLSNKQRFPDPSKKAAAGGAKASAEEITMSAQEIRQRIYALFAVFGVVIFFWVSFHQNGYSLTYFARDYVNLDVININLGFTTIKGAEIFQSVNPFFVVTLTPLIMWFFGWLRKRNVEVSTPMKIAIGMGIAATAYLFLMFFSFALPDKAALAGMKADQVQSILVTPWVMVGLYFILTVAELFISPLGLAFVSKVAPPHMQGLMQGFWLAATAVGNALLFVGGWLYMHTPMWATWCVFVAACGMSMLVMLSMVRWLERVTK